MGAQMPEIGATLREARMRARIDVSEIEATTKIRAKYLRALENEVIVVAFSKTAPENRKLIRCVERKLFCNSGQNRAVA